MILAIIQGPSWGWRSSPTLVLFGAAVLLLSGFANYELGRDGPLMNVRIFNNRTYAASAGAMATNFFCLFGFIFLVTQYFQLVRGYSALSAGVHTLPFAFTVMVATPLGALAALRLGTRFVVSLGLLVTAVRAGVAVDDCRPVRPTSGPIIGSMIVLAVGFSLVNAPSVAATMDTLAARPDRRRGRGQRDHARARRHDGRRDHRFGLRVTLRAGDSTSVRATSVARSDESTS